MSARSPFLPIIALDNPVQVGPVFKIESLALATPRPGTTAELRAQIIGQPTTGIPMFWKLWQGGIRHNGWTCEVIGGLIEVSFLITPDPGTVDIAYAGGDRRLDTAFGGRIPSAFWKGIPVI